MPREDLLRILRTYITTALVKSSGNSTYNIFDGLVELLTTNWDSSPTTMAEIRQAKKTKAKGDLFEHFALLYFTHCYSGLRSVWLLSDVPQEILDKLKLRRNDLGIDLILEYATEVTPSSTTPKYSAVQVKYRKQPRYKQRWGVTWQDLSTFYALVNRTGPFQRHIVFTNAHWARHIGKKTKTDQSICIGTLRQITKEQWRNMAGLRGHRLGVKSETESETESESETKTETETETEERIQTTISPVKSSSLTVDSQPSVGSKRSPDPLGCSGPVPLGRSGAVPLGCSGPVPLGQSGADGQRQRSGPVPLGQSGAEHQRQRSGLVPLGQSGTGHQRQRSGLVPLGQSGADAGHQRSGPMLRLPPLRTPLIKPAISLKRQHKSKPKTEPKAEPRKELDLEELRLRRLSYFENNF